MNYRCALHTFCASAALVLSACQTAAPPPLAEDWPEPADPIVALQPGDALSIRFVYWPELDEQQVIRPDGMISLRLVGEVQAEGLTPEELRQYLLELYEDKLRDPEITVTVDAFDSHRVYIGGEVQRPGIVMIRGKLTALEAIMEVGGFIRESAKPSSVVLVRQRDGKQYARTIDLLASLQDPQSDPVYLEPHDVIFVPRTTIDRVDQFVDQYINKIIPERLNTTFTFDLNPEEQNVTVQTQ